MTPSLEGWTTKAKEAPSPCEVRLVFNVLEMHLNVSSLSYHHLELYNLLSNSVDPKSINIDSIIRKVKCATLLNTSLLEEAKTRLIKMVQQWSFKDELRWLKSVENSNDLNKLLEKSSKISRLDPFLNRDEVIRVGGRLKKPFLNNECKRPILFPKVGKITNVLITFTNIYINVTSLILYLMGRFQ